MATIARPALSPSSTLAGFFCRALAPRPGRAAYAARIAALTALTVFIAEIFRVPEIAYSAYIVFFVSKEETRSTLLAGAIVLLAVTVSVFAALAVYSLSAGEPGVRLPLMAGIVFAGMFASRVSPLGPAGFAVGFLASIMLTLIDVIPGAAPLPSGEILTQAVLWLWVVAALPICLVVGYNIVLAHVRPSTHGGKAAEKEKHGFLLPDAFTNPDHVRYALKATLAIFAAYFIYNMLDWPEIRTCMITCFFVALGSYGETTHKMALRIAGAVIGGAAGLASVIFLMPYMTDIGQLCLLVGLWAFICAWVVASGVWLSYAGMQMAMAFFLSVLAGFGPTIELPQARDRVVGILLGNLIVFAVFAGIWPVNALVQARKCLALALEKLADFSFAEYWSALEEARRYIAFDPFEPIKYAAAPRLNLEALDALESLGDLASQNRVPAAVRPVLAAWLKKLAAGLMSGSPAPEPIPDSVDSELNGPMRALETALKTMENQT